MGSYDFFLGEWDYYGFLVNQIWLQGEAPIMSMIFTCSRQPFTSGSSQLCLQQFLVDSIPAKLRKV